MRGDHALGILVVAWRERVEASAMRTDSLGLIAAEAAMALERAQLLDRLEFAARTDELTSLPNRRGWEDEIARELSRARRDAMPLCVAVIDLDHFKRFNDARGHQAGDRLLKEATAAWRNALRGTDILARYGGEEFALALPTCGLEDALRIVERLRQSTPGGQTVSAGIAQWDGREGSASLFARADAALYESKRAGKDCTTLAPTAAAA
jgi:diguanylate cyclase (GGDEF)-like protein